MNAQNQKSVVLIAGPTASGKSSLAMEIAKARNGVIINADSMQVYGALRLLTARPSREDEAGVPHRLYGHVGADSYSVARWLEEAKAEIARILNSGQLPIICGGTGLYFKTLEEGLAELPPIPAEIRNHWRSFASDLHAELERRDKEGAALLNPSDSQRIIRALEVLEATGKPLRQWQAEASTSSALQGLAVERHYVSPPRAKLYERAELRFDQMMEQGALDEVRAFAPLPLDHPLTKAIGLRELQAHIKGEIALDEAVTFAKTATRHYIKRQSTWWRGQMKGWQ
jgi:tRNA dimethylallyltransferase